MGWFKTARQVVASVGGSCDGKHTGRWVRIKGGKRRVCGRCGHTGIVMGLASRKSAAKAKKAGK